jgi:predicted nucleic acid-binding protein
LLPILPALAETVVIPPAVENELTVGLSLNVNVPNVSTLAWLTIRQPVSATALPLVTDLGPGETEVLMLALESPGAVVVLDDALARQVAESLNLKLTGTLGLLLDAKRAGLIPAVKPCLDQLQALRFRLAPHTRLALLALAEEEA